MADDQTHSESLKQEAERARRILRRRFAELNDIFARDGRGHDGQPEHGHTAALGTAVFNDELRAILEAEKLLNHLQELANGEPIQITEGRGHASA